MAKQKSDGLSGGMGIIVQSAATLAMIVTWPLRAMSRDKAFGHAWRQGLQELGNNFGQMVPDATNTAQGTANIWSPTADDVATDRKPFKHFYGSTHSLHTPGTGRSPGEIARSNPTYRPPGPTQEQGPELEP